MVKLYIEWLDVPVPIGFFHLHMAHLTQDWLHTGEDQTAIPQNQGFLKGIYLGYDRYHKCEPLRQGISMLLMLHQGCRRG